MVTAFSYGLAPQGPINGAMIDIAGANLPPLASATQAAPPDPWSNMWRTAEASAGKGLPRFSGSQPTAGRL